MTVVSLPARGRPSQAAARRAGLELVRDAAVTRLGRTQHGQGTTAWVKAQVGDPIWVAEAEGFEPSRELPPYTLSKRAH